MRRSSASRGLPACCGRASTASLSTSVTAAGVRANMGSVAAARALRRAITGLVRMAPTSEVARTTRSSDYRFPRRPLSFRLPAAGAKTEAAGSWSCGFLCLRRPRLPPRAWRATVELLHEGIANAKDQPRRKILAISRALAAEDDCRAQWPGGQARQGQG